MNINEIMLESLRKKRNTRLQESDWTQMPDSPLSDAKKTEWATYRQQLRDLPAGLDLSSVTKWDDVVAETYLPTKPN